MDTKKLLEDSVAQIAELRPDQAGSDAGSTAFNSFRKGVVRASNSGPPEVMLGNLEPKGAVLTFLVNFHEQRRIFRKQIEGIFSDLLNVDSWVLALSNDEALCARLPDEMAKVHAEKEQELVDAAAPIDEPESPGTPIAKPVAAPDPWSAPREEAPARPAEKAMRSRERNKPKLSQIRSAIKKAAATASPAVISLPIRAAGPTVSGYVPNTIASKSELEVICELLEHGRSQIESLEFSAANADPAISAFETFRRGVLQVVNSAASKQEDNVLEVLEPKEKILAFLVDMYARHQKYRSRVTSTLNRLLNFNSWRNVAEEDASVHAAVNEFEDMRATGTVVGSVGSKVNMQAAAAKAVSRGGVGALYVQIVAGYNLVAKDRNGTSDPWVRVKFGDKTQRTNVIAENLNPRWNSNPFIFEVHSTDTLLRLECFDSDFFKDDPIGDLEMLAAQAPVDPESTTVRCALENVPHGELEFKLLYVPGKLPRHEMAPMVMRAATTPVPVINSAASTPAPVIDSRPESPAGSTPSWTPWGPAGTSEPSSGRKLPRSRNPFGPDDWGSGAGHPRARDIWKDLPVAFTPGQRRDPSRTSASAKASTPFGPGTPSGSHPAKTTNPFSADLKPAASDVVTNPFAKDIRPAATQDSPAMVRASTNPFKI